MCKHSGLKNWSSESHLSHSNQTLKTKWKLIVSLDNDLQIWPAGSCPVRFAKPNFWNGSNLKDWITDPLLLSVKLKLNLILMKLTRNQNTRVWGNLIYGGVSQSIQDFRVTFLPFSWETRTINVLVAAHGAVCVSFAEHEPWVLSWWRIPDVI